MLEQIKSYQKKKIENILFELNKNLKLSSSVICFCEEANIKFSWGELKYTPNTGAFQINYKNKIHQTYSINCFDFRKSGYSFNSWKKYKLLNRKVINDLKDLLKKDFSNIISNSIVSDSSNILNARVTMNELGTPESWNISDKETIWLDNFTFVTKLSTDKYDRIVISNPNFDLWLRKNKETLYYDPEEYLVKNTENLYNIILNLKEKIQNKL